ncbi:MAG: helix-turn-helix domain-containing protein [Flavobacteriales bacterium]|nr:helix-turn-helix domain-containing protein [Flavobacteriales bacterium]
MDSAERQVLQRLGVRIRTLREQRGIDQKQFAFDCEMSRTQLHLIEKGEANPRISTFMKIAKGFEMGLIELFM